MGLLPELRARLTLPVVCAPMFCVTGPKLVEQACRAGIIAGLPRQNARDLEEFKGWLQKIRRGLDEHVLNGGRAAPVAVNLSTRLTSADLRTNLEACRQFGVEFIISAAGDPTALAGPVHEAGMSLFHDVTNLRHAEKAMAAGVDGLVCIGAGGGGHSGTVSHLALIPRIRADFKGTIVLAGAVATGGAVRAAEVLGADLVYMGTRFIATQESMAPPAYKALLLNQTSADLIYTDRIAGVAANWLAESIRQNGLDPENLPHPRGRGVSHDHLPPGVRPWKTLWSAGQGLDLIDDIPTVAELVDRLATEYLAACYTPDMREAAEMRLRSREAARRALK